MNTKKHLSFYVHALTVLSLIFLTGCGNQKEQKILGTWEYSLELEDGLVLESEVSFMDGGKGTDIGTISNANESHPIVLSFDWKIKGDQLHTTITSSNVPELLPVGFQDQEKIVSIGDESMRTEYNGETFYYDRKQ